MEGIAGYTVAVTKHLLAVLALAAAAVHAPASAQALPPYATVLGTTVIRGVVIDYDGGDVLRLRDRLGYVDDVRLHQGTIITPVGQRLRPGMLVAIVGDPAAAVFEANAIRTDEAPSRHWQGYDRYGCSNAPAPPVHDGAPVNRSWRYDDRC